VVRLLWECRRYGRNRLVALSVVRLMATAVDMQRSAWQSCAIVAGSGNGPAYRERKVDPSAAIAVSGNQETHLRVAAAAAGSTGAHGR
jgi:hypothetical protein